MEKETSRDGANFAGNLTQARQLRLSEPGKKDAYVSTGSCCFCQWNLKGNYLGIKDSLKAEIFNIKNKFI